MWRKDLLRAQIDDLYFYFFVNTNFFQRYNDARSRLQNQTPSVPLIAATPIPNISGPKLRLEQLQSTKMVFELAKEKEALIIDDDDFDSNNAQQEQQDDDENVPAQQQQGYDSEEIEYSNIKQEQEQNSKKRSRSPIEVLDYDDDETEQQHRYDDEIATTIVELSNAIDDDPMDNETIAETKIPTRSNKRKATNPTSSRLEPAFKRPRLSNSRRDVIEKIASSSTPAITPKKSIKREHSNNHSRVHNVIIPILPSPSTTTTTTTNSTATYQTATPAKYVRGFFTEHERELFQQGVEKYEHDFALIQHEFLPHRSKDQIKEHYKYTVAHVYKRKQYTKTYALHENEYKKRLREERKLANGDRFNQGPWTRDEHARFLAGVKKYGRGKWKLISNMVVTRSMDQVTSYGTKYFRRMRLQGYSIPRSHRGWEDKPDNPWEPDAEFEKSLNSLIVPRVKGTNQAKLDKGEPITEADLEVYLELGSVPQRMRLEKKLPETTRTTIHPAIRQELQMQAETKQEVQKQVEKKRVQHVVDDDDVADDNMPSEPKQVERILIMQDDDLHDEEQQVQEPQDSDEFVIEEEEDNQDFVLEPDDSENNTSDEDDNDGDEEDADEKIQAEKIRLLQLFHYPKPEVRHVYSPQKISDSQILRIAQTGTRAKYKRKMGTSSLFLKRNLQLHRQPKRTRIKTKR